jgi:hypothetical protein
MCANLISCSWRYCAFVWFVSLIQTCFCLVFHLVVEVSASFRWSVISSRKEFVVWVGWGKLLHFYTDCIILWKCNSCIYICMFVCMYTFMHAGVCLCLFCSPPLYICRFSPAHTCNTPGCVSVLCNILHIFVCMSFQQNKLDVFWCLLACPT